MRARAFARAQRLLLARALLAAALHLSKVTEARISHSPSGAWPCGGNDPPQLEVRASAGSC